MPASTASGTPHLVIAICPAGRFVPATRLFLLVALVWPAGWCEQCGAETGSVHQTGGAGLSMTADVRWLDGCGYRPVRITFTPTRPVIADRTLKVECSAFDRRAHQDPKAARC